jgi:hypothetical protein
MGHMHIKLDVGPYIRMSFIAATVLKPTQSCRSSMHAAAWYAYRGSTSEISVHPDCYTWKRVSLKTFCGHWQAVTHCSVVICPACVLFPMCDRDRSNSYYTKKTMQVNLLICELFEEIY